MAGLSDRPPVYLSQRSADVVLSEIRPTKLAPEALRSVNVLLDELLWMILSMARSFATDQLKVAFAKILPTVLGKEALLEAEVELRAYWDRTTNAPSRQYAENTQEFPIQAAFELLRVKCESYSTFNDTDDDTDVEKRLQAKVTNSSGFTAHNMAYIAPAALYLTAILEHVCEHVLSNTGRVASRDSSRTTATLQDLFLALCEDDTIYGLFKVMRVHNQIESQCNSPVNRPGRSKSIHRSASDTVKGPSHANGSPYGPGSAVNGEAAVKQRVSSDSGGSGTAVATVQSSITRSSTEKQKTKKLFGRMSIEKEANPQAGHNSMELGHKRSTSIISNGKRPGSALDDGSAPSEVEFDELMRSGATMKVSLTPDRLRTFEVYSKEKGRVVNKVAVPQASQDVPSRAPLSDSSAVNRNADDPSVQPPRNGVSQTQKQSPHDQESKDEVNSIRSRKQSKAPPVSYDQLPHVRSRSTSASQSPIVSNGNSFSMNRKGSVGTLPVESLHSQSLRGAGPSSAHSKASASFSSSTLPNKRVHQTPSRDSIDDLMEDLDDDGPPKKGGNRRRAPTIGVSKQTADLIDFLNSGPPDLPDAIPSTPTPSGSIDNKMKRGRFRSIVSRLKGGQSMDKLSNQTSLDDFAAGKKSPIPPSPSFVPPTLSAKRSLLSLSSFAQSQVSLAKQATPPVPHVAIPQSPPLSPSYSFSGAASPIRPRPSPTSLRKAVPVLIEEKRPETGNESPILPKQADVSPPTPSKVEHEIPIAVTQQAKDLNVGSEQIAVNSHRPSEPMRTPPPSYPSIRPSSKQSQRHAMSPPSTPKAFASHAVDLRRLLANATSADECRLLVDMFLAQAGLPMKDADFPPDPKVLPTVQQESAVVGALLGDGEVHNSENEALVKKSVKGHEWASTPTPRSDEHYGSSAVYRKPVASDHTVNVVSADA